jgi:hypothetical protein
VHMAGVEDKHAAEAVRLSQLVMGFSDVLFDLVVCLIWDIPCRLKSACLCGDRSHFGAPARGTCLRRWSLGLNLARLPPP